MAEISLFRDASEAKPFSKGEVVFREGDSTGREIYVAVVEDVARLHVIDEKRFQFLVQQTPYFAIQVMKIMADRTRESETGSLARRPRPRRSAPGALSGGAALRG